jgi:NRPS condensation-like uncharacterized protein
MASRIYKNFAYKTKVNISIPVKIREDMRLKGISPSTCCIRGYKSIVLDDPKVENLQKAVKAMQEEIYRYDERNKALVRENIQLRAGFDKFKDTVQEKLKEVVITQVKVKNIEKILGGIQDVDVDDILKSVKT